jgi:hypothetical protein
MDESSKLALAVVAAAVILVGGYVAYNEFSRARDVDQAQQVLDSFRENGRQVVDEARRSQAAVAQQQAIYEWRERSRRLLAPDQRCVGGAVVQVRGNVYTQVGTIDRPVHCDGWYADQPLR